MQSPQSQSSQSQLPHAQLSQLQVSHLHDEQSQSSHEQVSPHLQAAVVAFASTATGQPPSQSLTEQLHSVQSHAPHFLSPQSHDSQAHAEPQTQSTPLELADRF